ncbi:next to BRCA1 gene 1 protein isoform X2 [Gadus morhua]|uniref:next to BRCA1 gene 1 protein isoform X2 n=1 Tax=Gadus morhua TaxID=8049 RepID=UPI0011B434EE|nr:next to BRCA1 gene 1 protein-like isoform X2 [Gadus morhua]
MDFYINLKVNFRGNAKNFLLSGSDTKSWETMEAMVKRSFGLCHLQVTYFDEENEEVSINSQAEYEEALKSAARQGNRLHMNVYETRGQPTRVPAAPAATLPAPALAPRAGGAEPKRGFRPPQITHCPALTQVVSRKVQAAVPEQGMVILKELKGSREEDKTPPAWFTSYMEKFKDQVVREAVEKICREFSGQCCIHKPMGGGSSGGAPGAGGGGGGSGAGGGPPGGPGARGGGGGGGGGANVIAVADVHHQAPEVPTSVLPGVPTSSSASSASSSSSSSSAPHCSSCRGQTAGGGYQCSVCTSCTLCEPCSFSHDPSHNLVRARTPLSIPEHGSPAPDHSRFYRRGDRSFRKAEKQRLKAEKRQLKAEVKEIRKQLRMERRGQQWSSSHHDGSSSPVLLQPRATQHHNSPERPKRPCPLAAPAMTAVFLDENLPDGTRLRPATKFIKYWKMRNTGTASWNADTKLKFMWGNLAVGSGDRWREVSVPFLQPGQVGVVSVALCAPSVEGSYTSHWRLAHAGEQFGPRVWCSIVVDPQAPAAMMADGILVSPCVTPQGKNPMSKDGNPCPATRDQALVSVDQEEYYIPSVDLLTAQDLLSFELLDINIVQELESVPNTSPADAPKGEGPGAEGSGGGVPAQEEGGGDLSGTQFVCETVIGSLTLEEAPDHAPVRGTRPGHGKVVRPAAQGGSVSLCVKSPHSDRSPDSCPSGLKASLPTPLKACLPGPLSAGPPAGPGSAPGPSRATLMGERRLTEQGLGVRSMCADPRRKARGLEEEKESPEGEDKMEEWMRSRSSSASSEDYIIILPDCFDTSRPLGDSMYSSALSQPGDPTAETPSTPETPLEELGGPGVSVTSSANDMLCTSQTLDDEPLTPEVVAPPTAGLTPSLEGREEAVQDQNAGQEVGEEEVSSDLYQNQEGPADTQPQEDTPEDPADPPDTAPDNPEDPSHPGITDELVKGALSVAASAYKALCTGQGPTQPPVDASSEDTMTAVLVEMGFSDRTLNQRLLRKHGFNLLDVVNELVQMTDNDCFAGGTDHLRTGCEPDLNRL